MPLLRKLKFRFRLLRLLCISIFGVMIFHKLYKPTIQVVDESTTSTTNNNNELPPWLTSKHIQDFNEELAKSEALLNRAVSRPACQIPTLPLVNPELLHVLRKQLPPLNCESGRFPLIFKSVLYPTPKLISLKSLNEVRKVYGITYCCMRRINDAIGEYDTGYIDYGEECLPLYFEIENDIPLDWQFLVIECQFSLSRRKKTRNIDVHSFIRSENINANSGQNKREAGGPNVILLGLGSTSHLNFRRVFPEVHEYLVHNLSAIEVTHFHKVGSNTFQNLGPLLTNQKIIYKRSFTNYDDYLGCETSGLTYDECPFVWKNFKAAGFKTFYGEDFGPTTKSYFWRNGFSKPPTDVFLRPLTFTAAQTIGHDGLGYANSNYISPKCFGPRPSFHVLLNSFKQFLLKSSREKSKYFGFMFSNSSTHDDTNGGRLIVQEILEMLKDLKLNGYLDNTVLIVFGDHGSRAEQIINHIQGYIEERLPFLYIVLPNWFEKRYKRQYNNLITNSKHRLLTHFDIYETLVDLLPSAKFGAFRSSMDIKEPGSSLFSDIQVTRTCEMAGIRKGFCACNLKLLEISTNEIRIKNYALQAIEHMNMLLKNKSKCAKLALNLILNAEALMNSEVDSIHKYRIVFATIPGNVSFEVLLRPNETTGELNNGN